MIIRFLLLACLCLGAALPVQARDLTTAERASLSDAVGNFQAALAAQDVVTLMAFVPPPVVAGMAERMGMTIPDMVQTLVDRTSETGGLVTVHSVVVDLDAAETGEAEGEPHLLIPTEIVITFPDIGTYVETSHTLAFSEQGQWRLVRLGDSEQRELLQVTYPRFAGVELPESVVEKREP